MKTSGLTAYTVTARLAWHCWNGGYGCTRRIEPGEEYVRVTVFPNHDVSRAHFPQTHHCCQTCWTRPGRPMPDRYQPTSTGATA